MAIRATDFATSVVDLKVAVLKKGGNVLGKKSARTAHPVKGWNEGHGSSTIHLLPFSSQFHREDLPSESVRLSNRDFRLRVYVPPNIEQPYNHFYLVQNGLGESQPDVYDEMCLDIAARKNHPVIFLPLPLHYCRHHAFDFKKPDDYEPRSKEASILTSQRIFQGIVHNPDLLVLGYKQTIEDIRSILRDIRSGYHPYWKHLLSPAASFSLFGYSFGGFSSLAFFLLEPSRVERVYLFESGGFIDQIDASVLFHRSDSVARTLWEEYYVNGSEASPREPLFSERDKKEGEAFAAALGERGSLLESCESLRDARPQALAAKKERGGYVYSEPFKVFARSDVVARELWRDVMATLYESTKKAPIKDLLLGRELGLFKQIYLGFERVSYARMLEQVQDRILIISGGADRIFPTRSLLELGPDTGLALLQVPGITHWVKHHSEERWKDWQEMVVDFMETFRTAALRKHGTVA